MCYKSISQVSCVQGDLCYARRSARASVGAASGLTAWQRLARVAQGLGRQPAAATTGCERLARRPQGAASSRGASPLVVRGRQLYFILCGVIDRSPASKRTQNILTAYLTTLRHHHTRHGPLARQASLLRCPTRSPDPWRLTLQSTSLRQVCAAKQCQFCGKPTRQRGYQWRQVAKVKSSKRLSRIGSGSK